MHITRGFMKNVTINYKSYFFIVLVSSLIQTSRIVTKPIVATDCTARFRQITGFNNADYTIESSYYPDHKITEVEVFQNNPKMLVAEVITEEKTFEDTPYGYISNLRVSNKHNTMGIDKALIKYLLAINRKKRLKCTLVVAEQPQHAFYKNIGFELYGTEDGFSTLRYIHARYAFIEKIYNSRLLQYALR